MPPVMDVRIDHLARLARLQFSSAEAGKLEADCRRILDMAASIQKLSTEGVQPLTHAMEYVAPLRADEPRKGLDREEAMKGAPSRDAGFFAVPKMKD